MALLIGKYFFNLASKESRRNTAKDSIEVALADENGNHQILTVQFSVDLRNNTEGGFLERRLELKNSSMTEVKLLAKPVNSGVVSAMGISSFFGGSIKFLVGDSAGNLHTYDGITLKKSAKVSDMSIVSLTVAAGTAYFITERSFGSWKPESSQPSQECTPFLGDSEAFSMILVGGQPQHLVLASNKEVYLAATHTMTKGCPNMTKLMINELTGFTERVDNILSVTWPATTSVVRISTTNFLLSVTLDLSPQLAKGSYTRTTWGRFKQFAGFPSSAKNQLGVLAISASDDVLLLTKPSLSDSSVKKRPYRLSLFKVKRQAKDSQSSSLSGLSSGSEISSWATNPFLWSVLIGVLYLIYRIATHKQSPKPGVPSRKPETGTQSSRPAPSPSQEFSSRPSQRAHTVNEAIPEEDSESDTGEPNRRQVRQGGRGQEGRFPQQQDYETRDRRGAAAARPQPRFAEDDEDD